MAKGLNEVRLIGNLTRDPELKTTEKGIKVCKFGIATNRRVKGEDGNSTAADFHNIVCFEKLAEIVNEYLKKGSKVYILGRLQNRKYIDKNNNTRTISEIIMNDMIMLDKKTTDQPDQEQEAPTEDIEVYTDEDQEPLF